MIGATILLSVLGLIILGVLAKAICDIVDEFKYGNSYEAGLALVKLIILILIIIGFILVVLGI